MRGVFWICTTAIRDNILGQGESWEGRLETNFQNGMKTHFFYYLSFLGSEPFHKMKMNLFYFFIFIRKDENEFNLLLAKLPLKLDKNESF